MRRLLQIESIFLALLLLTNILSYLIVHARGAYFYIEVYGHGLALLLALIAALIRPKAQTEILMVVLLLATFDILEISPYYDFYFS